MTTQLAFRDISFNVITRNNQIWLTSKEIANALGYATSRAVTKVFNQNQDEFTSGMTDVIEVPKSGTSANLKARSRIFSLRGAHLIAMFARTPVAKEFRRWVLDILEREVGKPVSSVPQPQFEYRYHGKVTVWDRLTNECVEFEGEAHTIKQVAEGIATDLGYKPVTVVRCEEKFAEGNDFFTTARKFAEVAQKRGYMLVKAIV
ncbi:Uncharacterized phage-encoded protein [Serratia quinivorans]|uniref:Uncharacterized phage-encoded protein n=1 Tax=Serratia quinivorans TaxID=137545 RepID=A0A380AHK8_9GAMM|nr:BRO family protein [Serratia proteamaculans]RYM64730.1 hypothetical protein BSR03_04260 [Serratia proteamaculans]SUI81164.1 Uncharacterized phage-encoded protein [Serratia quinivorans]